MILAVRLFRLDLPRAALAALAGLLDPAERERAARFRHDADRRRFVARRGQLRLVLADWTGTPAGTLRYTVNAFGKPALAGDGAITFNLSASADVALCVVARGIAVGCDVERRNPSLADPAVAERLFAPAECAALAALPPARRVEGFFNCWTRKEAFVKALGAGLSYPLRDFAVSLAPDEPARVTDRTGWSLSAFAPLPGYHAAIATPRAGIVVPPAQWLPAQEAFASSALPPASSAAGSCGAARLATESSISAAAFS